MSGRRESPRTAFRARRKSGRRPIPIIYIGEIIRPLFSQSGSGAVFVVVRAVSATPYRKTISPQTAQLSLLLLSLSMIGTTDGFLSDKSIRKLNDLVNTTLSMTPNPIFIGGGGIFDGRILNRVRRCFRVPDRRDFKWQTSRQTASPPRNSGSYFSNSSPVLSPWHTAMSAIGRLPKTWCRTVL